MTNKIKNNFFGMNMIFFFGVVEDRDDPLKMGRVRVRCFSWHTNDKDRLPTKALPWAQCMQPVTSASISGIGRSSTGLVEGSWVVGFFLDGDAAQKPMVLGSLPGIPTEFANAENGFNDPNGVFPTLINEPDMDRLARNDNEFVSPLLQAKESNRSQNIPTSTGGSWNEPSSSYNARYANNHVTKTESGHIFEIDDTPGAERIHEYHKSGTFKEISSDGQNVTRVVGDNYSVLFKNNNVYIKGSCNVTIDNNCTTYVKGDWDVKVDGSFNLAASGQSTINLSGGGSNVIADGIGLTTHTHTDPPGLVGAETSTPND